MCGECVWKVVGGVVEVDHQGAAMSTPADHKAACVTN